MFIKEAGVIYKEKKTNSCESRMGAGEKCQMEGALLLWVGYGF